MKSATHFPSLVGLKTVGDFAEQDAKPLHFYYGPERKEKGLSVGTKPDHEGDEIAYTLYVRPLNAPGGYAETESLRMRDSMNQAVLTRTKEDKGFRKLLAKNAMGQHSGEKESISEEFLEALIEDQVVDRLTKTMEMSLTGVDPSVKLGAVTLFGKGHMWDMVGDDGTPMPQTTDAAEHVLSLHLGYGEGGRPFRVIDAVMDFSRSLAEEEVVGEVIDLGNSRGLPATTPDPAESPVS